MASSTSTMTSPPIATAIDMPPTSSLHRRKPSEPKSSGHANGNGTVQRTKDTKYRHVFATHSLQRTSCLSTDAETSPSFVGFRNLMVLVLRAHPYSTFTCTNTNSQQSSPTCD